MSRTTTVSADVAPCTGRLSIYAAWASRMRDVFLLTRSTFVRVSISRLSYCCWQHVDLKTACIWWILWRFRRRPLLLRTSLDIFLTVYTVPTTECARPSTPCSLATAVSCLQKGHDRVGHGSIFRNPIQFMDGSTPCPTLGHDSPLTTARIMRSRITRS